MAATTCRCFRPYHWVKSLTSTRASTLGTVDIILTGASFAASSYPPLAVTYFPFIFRDFEHQLKYAKSDVFKELAKGYDDKIGNHITALNYYGARQLTSNRMVAKPEGMKGLKIRVPDAQENPLPNILAKKFFEVQKNISLTGHIVDSLLTVVGEPLSNKLSEADRKIFSDVMQEAAEKTGREIIASELRLVDEFKKKGINVITVDKNAFREAVLKNAKPADYGYRQADYDRITAIK